MSTPRSPAASQQQTLTDNGVIRRPEYALDRSKTKVADKHLQHLSELVKTEAHKQKKQNERTLLAEIIGEELLAQEYTHPLSYKTLTHGEAITYLEVFKHDTKLGRVKVSQGRNLMISLCYEKYDLDGSRYIKLYTHDKLIKNNKKGERLLKEFAFLLFEKYIVPVHL